MKLKTRRLAYLILISLCVGGCTLPYATKLKPEASKIRVSKVVPEKCKDLGEISGSACDDDIDDAMVGAKNALRNKALELGGNYASLETNNSRPCTGWVKPGTEVLLTGRAYLCESE